MENSENAFLTNSSIVRLIFAITKIFRPIVEIIEKRRNLFPTTIELLTYIDNQDRKQLICRPIGDILQFCYNYTEKINNLNLTLVLDKNIREHFSNIFMIQRENFKRRLSSGYQSVFGLPYNGNVLAYASDNDEYLFTYKPSNEVKEWFEFRTNFIFKFMKTDVVRQELSKRFNYDSPEMENLIFKLIDYDLSSDSNKNLYLLLPNDSIVDLPKSNNQITYHLRTGSTNLHFFIHLKTYLKDESAAKVCTVLLCPHEIRSNPTTKFFIEELIARTYDDETKSYGKRQARINVATIDTSNSLAYNRFLHKDKDDKLELLHVFEVDNNFNALPFAYDLIMNSSQYEDTLSYCPVCKTLSAKTIKATKPS